MVVIKKETMTLSLKASDLNTEMGCYDVVKRIKIYCQIHDHCMKDTKLLLPQNLLIETPPHLRHPNPDLGIKMMKGKEAFPTLVFPPVTTSI